MSISWLWVNYKSYPARSAESYEPFKSREFSRAGCRKGAGGWSETLGTVEGFNALQLALKMEGEMRKALRPSWRNWEPLLTDNQPGKD